MKAVVCFLFVSIIGSSLLLAVPKAVVFDFGGVMIDQKTLEVNREMYKLTNQLKEQEIFVAMLSNIDSRLAKIARTLGFYKPFELCLLSCEMGVEKPDLRSYEILLESLNLPAQEVVFIDDLLENVEAAKKIGIDAILFQSIEQIRQELKQRDVY